MTELQDALLECIMLLNREKNKALPSKKLHDHNIEIAANRINELKNILAEVRDDLRKGKSIDGIICSITAAMCDEHYMSNTDKANFDTASESYPRKKELEKEGE